MTFLEPFASQIADLTTELADERFKGDVACQVLESERAERLRAFREVQELKVRGLGWWWVAEQGGWEWLGLPSSAHIWDQ